MSALADVYDQTIDQGAIWTFSGNWTTADLSAYHARLTVTSLDGKSQPVAIDQTTGCSVGTGGAFGWTVHPAVTALMTAKYLYSFVLVPAGDETLAFPILIGTLTVRSVTRPLP